MPSQSASDAIRRVVLAAVAAFAVTAATAAAGAVTFRSDASCPTDAALAALARLDGVMDRRSCLVECAARTDCAAVHARPAGGSGGPGIRCYLGSYANWTSPDAWNTSTACETLVRVPSVPAALANRLLMFYNFRLGYENLVGNGTPVAVATATVIRSREGASLAATMAAYIDIAGPLRLTTAGGYTFFTKMKAAFPLATFLDMSLHVVYSSTPDNLTGSWKVKSNQTSLLHKAVSTTKMDATGLSGFGLGIDTQDLLSLAVVYDSIASMFRVYTGGSGGRFVAPTSVTTTDVGPGFETADTWLRIGYNTVQQISGCVICYAVAGTALTEVELRAMDAMC